MARIEQPKNSLLAFLNNRLWELKISQQNIQNNVVLSKYQSTIGCSAVSPEILRLQNNLPGVYFKIINRNFIVIASSPGDVMHT